MNFLTILICILSVPVAFYSIYYVVTVVLGLVASVKKPKTVKTYTPVKRFAVLTAARNEEKVITNLIDSLKRQDYPEHLYDIYVIPNNCTDQTEDVARQCGARILHIQPPIKTKGEVLTQTFGQLQECGYDGYVVFDADNVVSPNFLQRMNDALCAGYPAAQGRRDGKNPKDSWVSGCYTIYFATINMMINRVRMSLGRCANIYGTGFMVSSPLLAHTGFSVKTITEDMEYSILCALKGGQIAFVEDAVIYDEQPVRFWDSMRQRKRWTAGTYQCVNSYYSGLVSAVKSKSISAFDILLFALAPHFQVLATILSLVASAGTLLFQGGVQIGDMLLISLLSAAGGYIGQVVFGAIVLSMQGLAVKDYIASILTFPVFLLSWLPLNFYCLFKKDVQWEPIAHTNNISIRQLYPDQSSSGFDQMP